MSERRALLTPSPLLENTARSCDEAVELTPQGEFGVDMKTISLACLARLSGTADDGTPEQQYLRACGQYFSDDDGLHRALSSCLQQPPIEDQPLMLLAQRLALSEAEVIAMALALAVETDPMAGRAIAFLQAPIGGSRPTLGLLESALDFLPKPDGQYWLGGAIVTGMAVRSGALMILQEQSPLPERSLQLPTQLVLALYHKIDACSDSSAESNVQMTLAESVLKAARQQAVALLEQPRSAMLIRSASMPEARAVAHELCRQMNRQAMFIETDSAAITGLGPLCLISRRCPVFEYRLAPGEPRHLKTIPGYDGPIIALAGPDGHITHEGTSLLQWKIPLPTTLERQALWKKYLADDALATRLASDHVHSAGRILELSLLAQRSAHLHHRTTADRNDILEAAWSAQDADLGTLAQPIRARIPDEALVLSAQTRQDLNNLMQRCRHREMLDADLGVTLQARYQMGVKALMVGPSGTGKTLAASWIATRLGLPLYRVDLASVVSKYIGETEKNLASLLARAEQSEIVLLFDEADSLFGKRTDIKDSNDRHANSQTNYLLQRIEFYQGIVLLTSNSRGRFDSAFTRRLDKVIEFSLPSPEQRRALWQSHLGDHHQLTLREINRLSVGSDLAGGHIRNAVLTAAVSARDEARLITLDDVIGGLQGEYRKLGRQIPAEISRVRRPLPHQR